VILVQVYSAVLDVSVMGELRNTAQINIISPLFSKIVCPGFNTWLRHRFELPTDLKGSSE
jgi:hypothetical protein